MKNDIEILEESLKKYEDQNGKKAKALKERIDNLNAMCELLKEVLNEETVCRGS